MEARAGNSILDFETLFSDFQELLIGSGLIGVHVDVGLKFRWACLGVQFAFRSHTF